MTFPLAPVRRGVLNACDGPFGSTIKSDHYVDEGARVIRLGNIGLDGWRDGDRAFLPMEYWSRLARHHALAGDLVIAGLGDEGHPVGRAAVLPEIGPSLVKADCYRLRLDPERLDAAFIAYFLSSVAGLAESERRAEGSTRPRLTLAKALSLPVPWIPLAAQRQITVFLDTHVSRIDRLIAGKRQMIDLLDERRVSELTAGVAGHLSWANRRTTSVEWLADLPSDWRAAKLSLVARLGSGHTPSRTRPEWWAECAIPWITTGEVAEMRSDRLEYIDQTRECISEPGLANSSAEMHPAGTVVLSRTASAGYSAIMARDMATSQDFVTWTCGPLLRPRFLLLCLRAMRRDLLGRLAMGSTHKTIYMPDIESIRIPLPPVGEQDRIVSDVWERLDFLGDAEDKLERQVELLGEHRQALITAAVTGQMEIPGA